METIECFICRQSNEEPILHRENPRHVICRDCGLVYQNPRPTFEEMLAFYESEYWEERENTDQVAKKNQSRADGILNWLGDQIKPSLTVVEIGCGPGHLINYIQEQTGCRAIGIEPSKQQAEEAQANYPNVEFHCVSLEEAGDLQLEADILVLPHVFEHFHDPHQILDDCYKTLKAGGLIWIEVPNILNPHPKKRLENWLSKEHLFYYSVGTLGWFLKTHTYEIIREEGSNTFVRILAKKCPTSKSTVEKPNEYQKVKRAVWKQRVRYWPNYLTRIVFSKPGYVFSRIARRFRKKSN